MLVSVRNENNYQVENGKLYTAVWYNIPNLFYFLHIFDQFGLTMLYVFLFLF